MKWVVEFYFESYFMNHNGKLSSPSRCDCVRLHWEARVELWNRPEFWLCWRILDCSATCSAKLRLWVAELTEIVSKNYLNQRSPDWDDRSAGTRQSLSAIILPCNNASISSFSSRTREFALARIAKYAEVRNNVISAAKARAHRPIETLNLETSVQNLSLKNKGQNG